MLFLLDYPAVLGFFAVVRNMRYGSDRRKQLRYLCLVAKFQYLHRYSEVQQGICLTEVYPKLALDLVDAVLDGMRVQSQHLRRLGFITAAFQIDSQRFQQFIVILLAAVLGKLDKFRHTEFDIRAVLTAGFNHVVEDIILIDVQCPLPVELATDVQLLQRLEAIFAQLAHRPERVAKVFVSLFQLRLFLQ